MPSARIGASAAACQYVLPGVLREFKRKFPKCRLQIVPGDTAEIVDALRTNTVDVGFTLEPKRKLEFGFEGLFTDELGFLVDPKHPWAEETFRQLCRAGASQFAARNGLRSHV